LNVQGVVLAYDVADASDLLGDERKVLDFKQRIQIVFQHVQLVFLGDEILGGASALELVFDGGVIQTADGSNEICAISAATRFADLHGLALPVDTRCQLRQIRQPKIVKWEHIRLLTCVLGVLIGGRAEPGLVCKLGVKARTGADLRGADKLFAAVFDIIKKLFSVGHTGDLLCGFFCIIPAFSSAVKGLCENIMAEVLQKTQLLRIGDIGHILTKRNLCAMMITKGML
jgi:hypothetical protein